MKKHRRALRALCAAVAALIIAACASFTLGNALYNDAAYEKYANFSQDSSVPSLFRNDSVFSAYKDYPPVISDGIEYVPLELFYGLSGVKISFSDDSKNFYIQNKNDNKYISFSIDGDYAVTDANKVHETKVPLYYGTHYVPLRVVCSSTGIGCDSYNDGENKIYVIKVYVTSGLSAKELIKIHAPGIYGSTTDQESESDTTENSDSQDNPPENQDGEGGNKDNPPENFGRRTLQLSFVGTGLKNAPKILDTISAYRIKAAFFVTKEEILEYPDTVRRIYTEGHTIGITFSESAEELSGEGALEKLITDAEDALYEVLKTKTRLVCLPPDNAKIYEKSDINGRIEALGLRIVGFNLDARADILGSAAAGANLTESIKNLEANRGTTTAHIKLTLSESSRLVIYTLASLPAKHTGVVFGQITEVIK